jgi:phage-related protein
MVDYFTFNGVNTYEEYGVILTDANYFDSAVRSVTTEQVPGRNGELVFDDGYFENSNIKLTGLIKGNFSATFPLLRDWMESNRGYKRLEISKEPEEFFLARISDALEPETSLRQKTGWFSVKLSRKPQRFLKSGETLTQVTSGTVLTNPTSQTALPLINCYGSGTLTLGSQALKITGNPYEYITVDSDIKDCYFGDKNCNGYVTADSFPELGAGDTTVTFTGFTKIEIAPRWWRL